MSLAPRLRWRLKSINADLWGISGPMTETYPDDGALAIDNLGLTPQGDSLDGQITALPGITTLRARDVVILEIYDGTTWLPRWAGLITTGGNPRSTTAQTYRAAGIRQRLFEQYIHTPYLPGGDIATMVRTVLNDPRNIPAAMTFTNADAPLCQFELGARAGAYETTGDFLDAMTAMVGTFAVPPGETYTYDGHTYTGGDVVPPVEWGIRPDASIYFRRQPYAAPIIFAEGDNRVDIEWSPINVEDHVASVLLFYVGELNLREASFEAASGQDAGGTWQEQEPPPIRPAARYNGIDLPDYAVATSVSRVVIDGPQDFMDKAPAPTLTSSNTTNASNAVDGNPATYATLALENPPGSLSGGILEAAYASGRRDGAWRITYSTDRAARDLGAHFSYGFINSAGNRSSAIHGALPTTGDVNTPNVIWLPNLVQARYAPAFPNTPFDEMQPWLQIWNMNSQAMRVYEIEYWVPDGDLYGLSSRSSRYALSLIRPSTQEVARIDYQGLGSIARDLQITPAAGGSPIAAYAERITLTLDPETGIRTTYYVGQAWPAQIREQQVLLDRLARRAVDEGGRRR